MPSAAPPSFQTVRLARGRHVHPGHGVCVAELASMLAGERFSDRPPGACPVVTAFLRGYNDGLDDRRRQDLFPLASELVGSATGARAAGDRVRRILAFGDGLRRFAMLSPGRGHSERLLRCEAIGACAGRRARRRPELHERTLAFVRELLASTPAPHETAAPEPVRPAVAAR